MASQLFEELSRIENSDFQSSSSSVRIQITTNEDGSLEERRTVTTVGPDGVPHEETTVNNLSESSESLREHPLRIPMMDGFFPGRPSAGADHYYHPTESPEIKNRNLFLTSNRPPMDPNNSLENSTKLNSKNSFNAPFLIPDYAKTFSESINKLSNSK